MSLYDDFKKHFGEPTPGQKAALNLIDASIKGDEENQGGERVSRPSFETMETHEIYLWLTAHRIEVDLKELKTLSNLRAYAIEKYNELVRDSK